MITDNLAPLFDTGPPGVRFRQGTILTWDPNTGSNTVDLAGGTLTNVPILNTGEAIALKAGHIVGMIGQGSSWFIMGRVTPPNDPNFAGASVAFASQFDFQQGFSVPLGNQIQATAIIDVPAWADEAAVMSVATATLVNSSTVRQESVLYSKINGISNGGVGLGIPPDTGTGGFGIGGITASASQVITSPGSTITCTCVTSNNFAYTANGLNTATVSALAVFRSIA